MEFREDFSALARVTGDQIVRIIRATLRHQSSNPVPPEYNLPAPVQASFQDLKRVGIRFEGEYQSSGECLGESPGVVANICSHVEKHGILRPDCHPAYPFDQRLFARD